MHKLGRILRSALPPLRCTNNSREEFEGTWLYTMPLLVSDISINRMKTISNLSYKRPLALSAYTPPLTSPEFQFPSLLSHTLLSILATSFPILRARLWRTRAQRLTWIG